MTLLRNCGLYCILLLMVIPGVSGRAESPVSTKSVADQPTTTGILLINRPELWQQPDAEASRAAMDWKAGRRLSVTEVREAVTLERDAEGKDMKVIRKWQCVEADGQTGWLPEAYLAPSPVLTDTAENGRIGDERVDRYSGLGPDYIPNDLVKVGPGYDDDVNYRLRKEAAGALTAMMAAARNDGVKLYVVSAYRPWSTQQRLYQRRVSKSGWDQDTVARPGHSEHQLGTAVDLTDGDEETLLRESFGETKAGRWLLEKAWTFGFAISYTPHNRERTGYQPEPWHYRYWGLSQARRRHLDAVGPTPEKQISEKSAQ
jgi:hypothetical protein